MATLLQLSPRKEQHNGVQEKQQETPEGQEVEHRETPRCRLETSLVRPSSQYRPEALAPDVSGRSKASSSRPGVPDSNRVKTSREENHRGNQEDESDAWQAESCEEDRREETAHSQRLQHWKAH